MVKAHNMVPSKDTWHVSRGHKCVLKLVNFFVQNLQKPHMIDLGTHNPLLCDALWSICQIGGLWSLELFCGSAPMCIDCKLSFISMSLICK